MGRDADRRTRIFGLQFHVPTGHPPQTTGHQIRGLGHEVTLAPSENNLPVTLQLFEDRPQQMPHLRTAERTLGCDLVDELLNSETTPAPLAHSGKDFVRFQISVCI